MRTRHFKGVVVCLLMFVLPVEAYTLLDFPSPQSVRAGSYKKWVLDQASPPILSMSYAIQSDFLGGLAGAQTAVTNALTSWDQANTTLRFAAAGYQPVVNSKANWAAGGHAYEGPGAAAGGTGIGANIDIMSRPSGFTFTDIFNRTVTLSSTSLAMTVPISLSNNLLSVDVYLNSSFNWSTTGGHYDVQTVVLHELGHALGLDHPDQAAARGAANYNPWTHLAGAPVTRTVVMDSGYYPDGINRMLTNDEIGGLTFLYP
ncbi:MAG TPA: matrixin family metalloprotease, partial [Phycisphaerae bacterium]|nr:matrixin family metalloprotease [Phycisphaerae bacterium]